MSETQAAIGFGVLLKRLVSTGPDVYETIGQQTGVTPYDVSIDSIDATHEESDGAWREFISGLKDGGNSSIDIHYVPGGAAEASLFAMMGTTQTLRAAFPSGAHVDYRALITEVAPSTPIDDKMTATVTFKVTGPIVPTAAAAPVNAVLPAISGVAQVGHVLTAFPGVWSNEPSAFTYQWKKAGAAIGGAIAATYSPVVGDVDAALTVDVTGTNSAGSATATSAATPVVIAA